MKKGYLAVTIGIFLLIAGLLFMRWASSPSVAKIQPPNETTLVAGDNTVNFTTPRFTTKVPGIYRLSPADTYEQEKNGYLFISPASSNQATTIALAARPLPTGGLAELSAVQYRERSSDVYKKEVAGGYLWYSRENPNETAIFFDNGIWAANIVVTGVQPDTALESIAKQVLNAWEWK